MVTQEVVEDTIASRLGGHSVGLLSIMDTAARSAPVPFRIGDEELLCLVPRWDELAEAFERRGEQRVQLVVSESHPGGERWLCCIGRAHATNARWPGFRPVGAHAAPLEDRYLVIQISLDHLETQFHEVLIVDSPTSMTVAA